MICYQRDFIYTLTRHPILLILLHLQLHFHLMLIFCSLSSSSSPISSASDPFSRYHQVKRPLSPPDRNYLSFNSSRQFSTNKYKNVSDHPSTKHSSNHSSSSTFSSSSSLSASPSTTASTILPETFYQRAVKHQFYPHISSSSKPKVYSVAKKSELFIPSSSNHPSHSFFSYSHSDPNRLSSIDIRDLLRKELDQRAKEQAKLSTLTSSVNLFALLPPKRVNETDKLSDSVSGHINKDNKTPSKEVNILVFKPKSPNEYYSTSYISSSSPSTSVNSQTNPNDNSHDSTIVSLNTFSSSSDQQDKSYESPVNNIHSVVNVYSDKVDYSPSFKPSFDVDRLNKLKEPEEENGLESVNKFKSVKIDNNTKVRYNDDDKISKINDDEDSDHNYDVDKTSSDELTEESVSSKQASRLTTEKLAYILIGSCCALSILCLIIVAFSIRCRDMCDEYKAWKKAEKLAMLNYRFPYADQRLRLHKFSGNGSDNFFTHQNINQRNSNLSFPPIRNQRPIFGPSCCCCPAPGSGNAWRTRNADSCPKGYFHPCPRGKLPFGAASSIQAFPRNAVSNFGSDEDDSLNASILVDEGEATVNRGQVSGRTVGPGNLGVVNSNGVGHSKDHKISEHEIAQCTCLEATASGSYNNNNNTDHLHQAGHSHGYLQKPQNLNHLPKNKAGNSNWVHSSVAIEQLHRKQLARSEKASHRNGRNCDDQRFIFWSENSDRLI